MMSQDEETCLGCGALLDLYQILSGECYCEEQCERDNEFNDE